MAHLVDEKVLRKSGQTKEVNPSIVESASTEVGGRLHQHTIEDVERSLQVLAYNGSNYSRSSIQLKKEFNIDVHSNTLRRWAITEFPRKYANIQKDLDQVISEKLSGQLTDVAMKATEMQNDLLDDLNEKKGALEAKEIAPALRNVSQAAQPAIEKAQLLRGKPTARSEAKDADNLVSKLIALGIVKNPESLDIEDAEVIDPEESDDESPLDQ